MYECVCMCVCVSVFVCECMYVVCVFVSLRYFFSLTVAHNNDILLSISPLSSLSLFLISHHIRPNYVLLSNMLNHGFRASAG